MKILFLELDPSQEYIISYFSYASRLMHCVRCAVEKKEKSSKSSRMMVHLESRTWSISPWLKNRAGGARGEPASFQGEGYYLLSCMASATVIWDVNLQILTWLSDNPFKTPLQTARRCVPVAAEEPHSYWTPPAPAELSSEVPTWTLVAQASPQREGRVDIVAEPGPRTNQPGSEGSAL
jgi:hypothetical protein